MNFEQGYETVAAAQTDKAVGSAKVGTVIARLLVSVATAVTSTVSIKDGDGSAIPLVAANTAVGIYSVEVGMAAKNATTPGWKVTTGAGVSVIVIGKLN